VVSSAVAKETPSAAVKGTPSAVASLAVSRVVAGSKDRQLYQMA